MDKIHLKFIDDMTAAESINLKETLVPNPDPNPERPFRYHDRTQHVLPKLSSQLQTLMDDLQLYTSAHQMKINDKKTKVILFNSAKNHDFFPQLSLGDGPLQVVEEVTLLGVKVSSDLSWRANTSFMCQKAYAKLWMLRRLKPLGAKTEELLDIYDKQIRCTLEFAVAVWAGNLTNEQSEMLERVQKSAFAIILADDYTSYKGALKQLCRTTLAARRSDLCLRFANKSLKNEKYQNWFCENNPNQQQSKTRSIKPDFVPVEARTKTFGKSPLAYLTSLLNKPK